MLASAIGIGERGGAGDARADAALAVRAVALRADAFPLFLAELARPRLLLGAPLLEPRVELVARHDLDRREHLGVLETAELGALAGVGPLVLRLEPCLVGDARDRVDLAAERGDPPRVDDVRVRGGHLEAHGHAGRRAHLVDRDDAVRILVLPVELPAGHLDLELLLTRRSFRDVLDSRQLDEHEGRDEEEHDDRAGRPRELELRRAVGLRAVLEARRDSAAGT